MSPPEVASQSLAVLSMLAVRIRVPSGLNVPYRTSKPWGSPKGAISLPEAASQSLTGAFIVGQRIGGSVFVQHVVRIRAPSGLNAACLTGLPEPVENRGNAPGRALQ